ncbi:uncharacterized protein LDX57_007764 [Aspergillus melleus]|uniref:uncharacterized protein n=1 Tax=Aspergillus melleus TaxID=138277 RepID=UPI001E8E8095|nr:uncharacterized protein LDX57_007764 [Aspergillus melleus]KAH8430094.1 hypothetical protein LDX57_007764 [Aspergillus melleus]
MPLSKGAPSRLDNLRKILQCQEPEAPQLPKCASSIVRPKDLGHRSPVSREPSVDADAITSQQDGDWEADEVYAPIMSDPVKNLDPDSDVVACLCDLEARVSAVETFMKTQEETNEVLRRSMEDLRTRAPPGAKRSSRISK